MHVTWMTIELSAAWMCVSVNLVPFELWPASLPCFMYWETWLSLNITRTLNRNVWRVLSPVAPLVKALPLQLQGELCEHGSNPVRPWHRSLCSHVWEHISSSHWSDRQRLDRLGLQVQQLVNILFSGSSGKKRQLAKGNSWVCPLIFCQLDLNLAFQLGRKTKNKILNEW